MQLSDFADQYRSDRNIARLNLRYSAQRFERLFGVTEVASLTTDHLTAYRAALREVPLAARTIESAITDLQTLYYASTGATLSPGRRLKLKRPVADPASLDQIASIYEIAPPWVQQWVTLAYWTCLRLTDCLTYQRQLSESTTSLEYTASKTGRRQSWPLPDWLLRHVQTQVAIPRGAADDRLQKVLRAVLRNLCTTADVDRVTPHQVRQRGLTEWSRANAMAGQIVHGSGLGVLNHYVDPLTVLESAAPMVRLPAGFADDHELTATAALPALVSRLDPDAQELVLRTAQRLAR